MPWQEILEKVIFAIIFGGIIGAEREYRSKSAGLRTMVLICVGATVFTMMSMVIGAPNSPDRIASNIVTGIGFVGAGVIYKMENRLSGITTAASIWVTASLGMAIGAGHYWVASIGCGVTILVLLAFKFIDKWIDHNNIIRDYKIVYNYDPETFNRFDGLFKEYKLEAHNKKRGKNGNQITGFWKVAGSKENHHKFIQCILQDNTVMEFEY
ncbi:MgtC/SapB family protein [Pinibacter soli]|uniref:MgtC/SapB family protein n=1 Tax=Pinibacter soli TaxID=3044211 RepID=A0ABT6RB31_9BACT|nr:MgtC/SapB family protein [Pinibacter soli]MDI3319626.1 MgtC/SapB family protein [Pinibacter soli]